jgi:YggT family protein
MIAAFLIRIIDILANLMVLVVIASALVSYFLSPYHPVRVTLDRIVNPLLAPIRRVIPMAGMIDFSPLVLVILIEIASFILKSLISYL